MTSFKYRHCVNKDLVQQQSLQKGWKLTNVKKICQHINQADSAVQHHPGSG